MSNPIPRRASSSLVWLLGFGLLSAGLLPISAWAREGIQRVRLAPHPGYQRIVLEVADSVEAYITGEPKRIEIDAEPPTLAPEMREQLAGIGVRLERSGRKTQIVLEPGATGPWTAFRLKGGPSRIVVDLGPGAPALPGDAETLREIAAPAQPSLASAALPDVAVDSPSAAPRPSKAASEAPIERRAGTNRAEARVRITGLDLVGLLPKGPTRDEILDLGLSLRRTPSGDWEAANGATDAQKVSLRSLTSSAADGPALMGSVLQQVVTRIAAAYADRGLFGTRVDIRQSDLDRLIDQAGPLVVHIRPDRAAAQ